MWRSFSQSWKDRILLSPVLRLVLGQCGQNGVYIRLVLKSEWEWVQMDSGWRLEEASFEGLHEVSVGVRRR